MATTVTIEIDDAGAPTVSIDGKEVYRCESIAECLEYLEQTLGESAEPPAEEMWDQEAQARPGNPNLMA